VTKVKLDEQLKKSTTQKQRQSNRKIHWKLSGGKSIQQTNSSTSSPPHATSDIEEHLDRWTVIIFYRYHISRNMLNKNIDLIRYQYFSVSVLC